MKDGRIQQADAPLTVYNYPVNRFVAGFIGMPPMNFFEGRIAEADGKGIVLPPWLAHAPLVGTWLAARWQGQLSHPGALLTSGRLTGSFGDLAI